MSNITTRTYDGGLDGAKVVWIDADDPTDAEVLEIADRFGLHHLAVEDAVGPHQRDKYVHYQDHRFLVAHAVRSTGTTTDLDMVEFDTFIGDGWFVTVHRGGAHFVAAMVERWDKVRDLAGCHVGVAVYAFLSVITSGYFDVVDRFETFYDDAADRVFGDVNPGEAHHREKFDTRKALDQFTRKVDSLSEAVAALVDDDIDRYGPEAAPYLTDVKVDLRRLAVELDGLSGLVGQLLDADMLLRDHRQNVVMKKVTSWAAIIAVPTLVTGFYGMNVPYPGEGETWGVAASTSLAVAGSIGLYALFTRRRWL